MAKNKKLKGLVGLAAKADKYDCYQQSVQDPEHEVEMFDRVFQDAYARKPLTLREDFCGTFAVCCQWASSHARRKAWGVDLSSETLQWGRDNNLSKLKPAAAKRVQVLEQDVREQNTPSVDVLAAENFSFWIFRSREEMIDYFKVAYSNLAEEGVMVLDMMGGKDCYESELTEKRTIVKGKKGFKYHWEHVHYNPVNSHSILNIHFKFADGSKIKKAFEYEWRFWTIPEVREMLAAAGFRESVVYWDEADEDEDSRWIVTEEMENDDCWICYIVGIK
ncbi:MAG: class I SAM-dependent methyltransferase [Gammaproteobacteria bacterium]|nr:class I SAM-dependent methyltransferase [Gammaproteobacteria bacterium]